MGFNTMFYATTAAAAAERGIYATTAAAAAERGKYATASAAAAAILTVMKKNPIIF
jgi:hypothetical protein